MSDGNDTIDRENDETLAVSLAVAECLPILGKLPKANRYRACISLASIFDDDPDGDGDGERIPRLRTVGK